MLFSLSRRLSGVSGFLSAVRTGCGAGRSLSSCSNTRAGGMWRGAFPASIPLCPKTQLQTPVVVLLQHLQTCWIPWSASRGVRDAFQKQFWCLRQAKVNLQPFPTLLLQGPREAVETSCLEIFRTQWDEALGLGWRPPNIQNWNVSFPVIRCFCFCEDRQILLTQTPNAPGHLRLHVVSSVSAQHHSTPAITHYLGNEWWSWISVLLSTACMSAEDVLLFPKCVHCYIKPSCEDDLVFSSVFGGTRP